MKRTIAKLVLVVAVFAAMMAATGCSGGNVYVSGGVVGPYGYGPYGGPYGGWGGVTYGMPIYP